MNRIIFQFGIILFVLFFLGCAKLDFLKREKNDVESEVESFQDDQNETSSDKTQKNYQPKKRVYVLTFWNDTPVDDNSLGLFAAEEMRRVLGNSKKIIIPDNIHSEVETKDLIEGDKVKIAQLVRYGRQLGLAAIVIGRISKAVFRQDSENVGVFRQVSSVASIDMEVKVFDVQSGREIGSLGQSGREVTNAVAASPEENRLGDFKSELMKLAIRNAAEKLDGRVAQSIGKLSWEGRVAKVSGQRIFVNAGKASGLLAGDILKVLTPGEDIYDPQNGAYLGRSQGQMKGTLEVQEFLGTDGAITQIHTGGNFQEGDSVLLY